MHPAPDSRPPLDAAALRRLAVNENGFVFDPVTGRSFTVNASGRQLLARLAEEPDEERLVAALVREYAATPAVLRRDIHDFTRLLQEQLQ
jgi:hypothetical protein